MQSGQERLRWQEEDEERTRTDLLAAYRRMVREELPAAASAGNWPLRRDHCFARVILDAVCGGCWYTCLSRKRGRSAESQLDAAQLAVALRTGREMLTGGAAAVKRLNTQSLRWRGKTGNGRSDLPCSRTDVTSPVRE